MCPLGLGPVFMCPLGSGPSFPCPFFVFSLLIDSHMKQQTMSPRRQVQTFTMDDDLSTSFTENDVNTTLNKPSPCSQRSPGGLQIITPQSRYQVVSMCLKKLWNSPVKCNPLIATVIDGWLSVCHSPPSRLRAVGVDSFFPNDFVRYQYPKLYP